MNESLSLQSRDNGAFRALVLIANSALMLLTATSLLYSIQTALAPLGVLVGLVLAAPGLAALFRPQVHNELLIRVNTFAIVMLVSVIFLVLYLVVGRGQSDLALNQLITLVCALGLCANSQLIAITNQHREATAEDTVNTLLHRVYGGPSIGLFFALALAISGLIISLLGVFADSNTFIQVLKVKLLDRGFIPFLTLGAFFWGLLLLLGNYVLVSSERRRQTDMQKVNPSLVLYAFDQLAMETRARGREGRLEQLQLFMEGIWDKVNYFYTLPRFLNWAIPILGFLGTVLGISLASESIATVIQSNDAGFGSSLGEAFAPLGIAFDTTLVSLTLSLILMLIQSLMQRWQERGLHSLEQKLRQNI